MTFAREILESTHGAGGSPTDVVDLLERVAQLFVVGALLHELDATEDAAKGMEGEVEKLTGIYNKKVDALVEAKEKDIMKV